MVANANLMMSFIAANANGPTKIALDANPRKKTVNFAKNPTGRVGVSLLNRRATANVKKRIQPIVLAGRLKPHAETVRSRMDFVVVCPIRHANRRIPRLNPRVPELVRR
jgi:hypothetical protein